MKIVHFAKFYPPEYGGIESVTEALAEDHAAAGHDVKVVCFAQDTGLQRDIRSKNQGLRILQHKVQIRGSQPLSLAYLISAIREGNRANVIHLHAPNLLASLAALMIRRQTKVVVQWHGDVQKGWKNWLIRPLEYLMLHRAQVIACTSRRYSDGSLALQSFGDKTVSIPLGIEDSPPPAATTSVVRKDRKYVLFVGRLVAYKGIEYLLDAIPEVTVDLDFVIVGQGPLHDSLKERAKRLGIDNRVIFTGRCSQEEVLALFAGAKLFCLPSFDKREAFGVVLLEAMRMSLPIVTCDIEGSGVPWVNQHRLSGTVVPVKQSAELARAIQEIASDESLHRRLSEGARQRFIAEFLRDRMSERFLRLYIKLVQLD